MDNFVVWIEMQRLFQGSDALLEVRSQATQPDKGQRVLRFLLNDTTQDGDGAFFLPDMELSERLFDGWWR